jgi:GalNAc-alpha-(1->4)-GalNAc-alpha-(1->3)-diNAcBac-PP-undecaprenol alpha-1,4-N-acetyl-D-galactosaminyltransferase
MPRDRRTAWRMMPAHTPRMPDVTAMRPGVTVAEPASAKRAPQRLVLIIGSLQGGGAERQLSDMANYWAAQGAEVTLATWSGAGTKDFYSLVPGVSRLWLDASVARRLPFAGLILSVRRILELRRALRNLRPDAVVSFIDISNVYTLLASRGLDVRVVVAERTHPAINRTVSLPWRLLRRICYWRADAVVAQTHDAGRWLKRNCGARVRVIANSLRDLPQIQCDREPMIIAVGRLSKEKGFDLLLKAFAKISQNFPSWRVSILGDGLERGALTRLRDELNLADRVEFVGEVQHVELWMARAGLLVHPSRREGFPNAVLEAMGMGLAVICADCRAGPSELIKDGINGRLVPVNDVDVLARVMSELMAAPQVRERLGCEARLVRKQYAQDAIMDKWQACLSLPP